MSFVMIATGLASGGSRVRTLSIRSLLLGGSLAALTLLAAGGGVGWWLSAGAAPAPTARVDDRARATLPFALEQLGALSGRLFKLENQATQLSERIGARPGGAAKDEPRSATRKPGTGGPMLPPREAADALGDLGALETRIAEVEQQMALVADASAEHVVELMRLPTRRPIADAGLTSTFGNRDDPLTGRRAFHAGLDFSADVGTPIHAAAGGKVSFAGFRSDFGWVVEIAHGNGLTTRYAHASRLLVAPDTLVTPGEVIAMVGNTGRSTGPHLHFEVLRNGEPTDPRRYLAGL